MTKVAETTAKASAANTAGQSNVTELVVTSKLDRAKTFFTQMSAENYTPGEGSSPRKDFIAKCVGELGMTENGASTYWQNLRNESKTGNMYPHAKAPTGAPRGRRVDQAGRMKKAAARVQKERKKVEDAMAALSAAESDLVDMSVGLIEAQAS